MKLGDCKPEKQASVPLETLAKVLVRHVVDDYHNRPHEGLGGETPRNAWNRLVKEFGRIGVPDRDTQRAIFGLPLTYSLSNGGVYILGLRYQNEELHTYFCQKGPAKVPVRLDPIDIGRISVKLGTDWVTVPCRKPEFDGVTLSTWLVASADLRARFKNEASLVRPVVLEAVRAADRLSRKLRDEAGISAELDTPEEVERAREKLTAAWILPEWPDEMEDPAYGDVLAGVIPTGSIPLTLTQPTDELARDEPDEFEPPPTSARTWRMGDRGEHE